MIFRKADASDAKTVLALYRAVIGTPFCVWDESYPGETEIQGDLAAGTLYVLARDSEVIGAISGPTCSCVLTSTPPLRA